MSRDGVRNRAILSPTVTIVQDICREQVLHVPYESCTDLGGRRQPQCTWSSFPVGCGRSAQKARGL